MYKPKYTKTNLRNPKHNNPNPRDSDQRERKSSPYQHSLGLAWPGSRTVVVYLGHAWWSEVDLKPPTPTSIFSLFLFLVFFFFFFFSLDSSLMFWWFFSNVFLVYKGQKSSLRDSISRQTPCGKNATSDVINP